MKRSTTIACTVALATAVLSPPLAQGHGFGERYDLPVPLGLYVAGAGSAVLLSFIVIGAFVSAHNFRSYPRLNLLRWRLGRALTHSVPIMMLQGASALVFVVYILAGLFGTENPDENLVPTMTWVIFWVGVVYVSALVGNIWALLNPWKVIFGYAEAVYRQLFGSELSRAAHYPDKLGAWPAVALFFLFAWIEIAYTNSAVPLNLVILVLAYSVVTFVGMSIFGRDVWLRNGEAFSIVLGYLAAIAPTEVRVLPHGDEQESFNDYEAYAYAAPARREWNLRPWGVGLLVVGRLSTSQAVLLVLMLATVTFDGFAETPQWTQIMLDYEPQFDFLGIHSFTGVKTVGLIVMPVLFGTAFVTTAKAMGLLARSTASTVELVRIFAYSLVPIALAYHVAHFFSFLMVQGQRIVALASDPFGRQWNLFGTADVGIRLDVVNARFVWLLSIAAIVVGHIIAVYVAHTVAARIYPSRGDAIRSQYPMLVLMVAYTMMSLWIVAQPLVVGG